MLTPKQSFIISVILLMSYLQLPHPHHKFILTRSVMEINHFESFFIDYFLSENKKTTAFVGKQLP